MKILSHTHIGTRSANEDALGSDATAYIVCDGVGGHNSGEVASHFVVEQTLLQKERYDNLSKSIIQNLLGSVQLELNTKLDDNPVGYEGMGTTFCGVFLDNQYVYFAHIGDSRIYWLRPKTQQVWHTWDHSMVGDLVRDQQISREEGRNHPNSNRIHKAIIANAEGGRANAEVTRAQRIDEGDIFFVCTDGVNEAFEEYSLVKLLLSVDISLEKKHEIISSKCSSLSNDNNTFLLMEVEKYDAFNNGENEEINWLDIESFRSQELEYEEEEKSDLEVSHNVDEEATSTSPVSYVFYLFILLAIVSVLYFIFK